MLPPTSSLSLPFSSPSLSLFVLALSLSRLSPPSSLSLFALSLFALSSLSQKEKNSLTSFWARLPPNVSRSHSCAAAAKATSSSARAEEQRLKAAWTDCWEVKRWEALQTWAASGLLFLLVA